MVFRHKTKRDTEKGSREIVVRDSIFNEEGERKLSGCKGSQAVPARLLKSSEEKAKSWEVDKVE